VSVREAFFLFYVKDQAASAAYYKKVLALEPILDVPGITEFRLLDGSVFAVMPTTSAAKLIGARVFPSGSDVPKAELYLVVDDAEACHARALRCGGVELSPMQRRDWGHRAAYSVDPDGHVLAFAEKDATT